MSVVDVVIQVRLLHNPLNAQPGLELIGGLVRAQKLWKGSGADLDQTTRGGFPQLVLRSAELRNEGANLGRRCVIQRRVGRKGEGCQAEDW